MLINDKILDEILKNYWENLKQNFITIFQKKLTAGSNIKIENNIISCDVSTMNFKGSVATYADLPASADIGDAYNVVSDNTNYCWNGNKWSVFGNSVSYSEMLKSFLNIAYPVGCYYWSSDSTEPSTMFGGEWERVKSRFIYAKDDATAVGTTGGEASHTLTVAEMPKHNHGGSVSGGAHQHNVDLNGDSNFPLTAYPGWNGGTSGYRVASNNDSVSSDYAVLTRAGSGSHTHSISSQGSGSAHNNMPPYVVAYCWHRIA